MEASAVEASAVEASAVETSAVEHFDWRRSPLECVIPIRDQITLLVGLFLIGGVYGLWWLGSGAGHDGYVHDERIEVREAKFLVDPNRAGWPELSLLPGVGVTIANRIVRHRNVNGPFVDASQLQQVKGIGPATLNRMLPYLLEIESH